MELGREGAKQGIVRSMVMIVAVGFHLYYRWYQDNVELEVRGVVML